MKRMFSVFALCMFFVLFIVLPGVAQAGESVLGAALGSFVSHTVFPVVGALVAGLAGWALMKVAKKWELDFLLEQRGHIERAAFTAVSFVEEYAARQLKNSGIRMSSNEKVNEAVARVLEEVPGISAEKAKVFIEAMLPQLKGVGATGDKTI